jgi:SNF2 family DNA or RNA helicase
MIECLSTLEIRMYKFKTEPYKHQTDALRKCWDKESFAIFAEMGTGKTKIALDNACILYNQGKIDRLLVIAPKGVYMNWLDQEIPIHVPNYIEKKVVIWRQSESQKYMSELRSMMSNDFELKIMIMNVEAFSTKKGYQYAKLFLIGRSMMIIDESTTIKNPKAKRTKAILELRKETKYRRILTGSPVTQSPMDLWAQMDFLDPEILGQSSYYAFRTRYAVVIEATAAGGTHRYQKIVKFKNLKELGKAVSPHSYRVLKKDCLDLPDKVYSKRFVELSDEQKKAYAEMKANAMSILKGESMTAVNVLTQLIRLHQITCGHMKTDSHQVIDLKNNRLTELMQILDETSGKAIIWANYIHDIEAIEKAVKKEFGNDSCCTYYGATAAEDRQKCVNNFQDPDSPVRFFIGNTQTGGYGLTLTAASTVIYYSNNYDLEKRIQSEDRAHRIGQTNKVLYIDLIAEGTVDEKIIKSLRNKVNIAKEISGEELITWI